MHGRNLQWIVQAQIGSEGLNYKYIENNQIFVFQNLAISMVILAADLAITPYFKELIHVTTPIGTLQLVRYNW